MVSVGDKGTQSLTILSIYTLTTGDYSHVYRIISFESRISIGRAERYCLSEFSLGGGR
jgi:hypothetical protein